MPFQIVRNDLTRMKTDAIVNAAKPSLLGGGGVDGAIHKAAGPELLAACRKLGGCRTGEAKITGGYRLPAKFVIHTVGPVWQGGDRGEPELLASCYRSSLELAWEKGCESIAFPLISSGAYGYPADRAIRVATDTIRAFLEEHDMDVYLVVYGNRNTALGRELFPGLREYIDDRYVMSSESYRRRNDRREDALFESTSMPMAAAEPKAAAPAPEGEKKRPAPKAAKPVWSTPAGEDTLSFPAFSLEDQEKTRSDLSHMLGSLDESFQQMLLRKIDEKGLTDPQCYKKANLDRKLFSKIRGDVHYQPSKRTALALAIALELDLPETENLLRKAGYALSPSSVSDVIIEYFILHRVYDVFVINEALFAWDQVPLGG